MTRGAIFWFCAGAAAATGVAVEFLTGQRREAWDVESYWTVGLPLMVAAALLFGFLAREQPVVIGYAPFAGQLVAMLAKHGVGSMIVMGLFLLGVLGLTGVAAAHFGVRVARRSS